MKSAEITESYEKRLVRNIEVLDDDVAEILKKKTPQERLEIASDMGDFARELLMSNLHNLFPDWSEEKIRAEVAKRMSNETS